LAVKVLRALLLSDFANLAGKIIIDRTNPIDDTIDPDHGLLSLFTGINDSLMERLHTLVLAAKFVKAFNSAGNRLMYKPALELRPTKFIAGNDAEAKQTVMAILDKFGWEAEAMGSAEGARAIAPLCILWCIHGALRNQWSPAFKLLK
jgi:8-hydroxy-5-deazaflavin:NADPH oxidoreductase